MKFNLDDLDRDGLTQFHRDTMVDCILAWARFDSHFRSLLSAMLGLSLDEGARQYNRIPLQRAWQMLLKALRDKGATDQVLEAVRNNKRSSKQMVEPRDLIAHAGCIGTMKSKPDFVVFAPFASDRPGEMTIVCTPLIEIQRSTSFAVGAAEMCDRVLRAAGH